MTGFADRHALFRLGSLISTLLAFASCVSAQPPADARTHIEVLSGEIGSRLGGSAEEARAADYIAGVLEGIGYDTVRQPFSFVMRGRGGGRVVDSANVIATKVGSSGQVLIVGAHYDSQGEGRGADDNASGVGVMLQVAASLSEFPTRYTIRFVAFGSEEQGLRGSRHYVSEMQEADIRNTIAMINIDSLIAGDVAYVYGSPGDAGVVRDWILDSARSMDIPLVTQPGLNPEYPAGTTGDFSDHAPFEDAGIQYAYFESTNWALGDRDGYVQVDPRYGDDGYIWHTPYDSLEYIETTFPGRVDQRLSLFAEILYLTLTEFTAP